MASPARSGAQGTSHLAAIVLRDNAHLQEADAAYARHAGYSKHDPAPPPYDATDAEQAIKLFRPIGFAAGTVIADDVEVTLGRAGHILGFSARRYRYRWPLRRLLR